MTQTPAAFADRLAESVRRAGAPLCLGLDPFAARIPALFGPPDRLETVEAFFTEVLTAASGQVAAIKPQIGLFEPWGGAGWDLAARLSAMTRDMGIPTIMDAKRGDIGSTAEGYAAAFLEDGAPGAADCLTVNPYLGLDTLAPFADSARRNGGGLAVLVRTSNPGARDFQDLDCGGVPLWVRVAEALGALEDALASPGGRSSLMVVCGATWPEEARRLRSILPRAPFLVPGYGAQGAGARDAMAGFWRAADGAVEGGVVSSSRALLYPPAAAAAPDLNAWRAAFHEGLAAACADLQAAASGLDVRPRQAGA